MYTNEREKYVLLDGPAIVQGSFENSCSCNSIDYEMGLPSRVIRISSPRLSTESLTMSPLSKSLNYFLK